jgi:hypothetical protein
VDPLCWLEFTEESIITSCKSGKSPILHVLVYQYSPMIGHIRTWDRPRDTTASKSDVTLAST